MRPTTLALFLIAACNEPTTEATAEEAIEEATEAAAEATAEAAQATAEAAQATERAAQATAQAAVATEEAAANAPTKVGLAALREALAAGSNPEGATHCEQAFNGAQAMIQVMQKQGQGPPQGELPDRARFMEVCNTLPAIAQQCMVVSYAMGHGAECQAALNSPEVTRAREAMQGR